MSMESSDIVIDRSPWLDLPVDLQNVLWGWVCVGDKDEFIRFLSKHKPNYTEEQSKDAFGIALSLRHPKPSTLGTPNTSTPINQKGLFYMDEFGINNTTHLGIVSSASKWFKESSKYAIMAWPWILFIWQYIQKEKRVSDMLMFLLCLGFTVLQMIAFAVVIYFGSSTTSRVWTSLILILIVIFAASWITEMEYISNIG
eukprot:620307_1